MHPTASIARSSALILVGNLRNGRNKALGDKKPSIGLSERAVPECLRVLTRRNTLSSYHHHHHAVSVSLLSTLNVCRRWLVSQRGCCFYGKCRVISCHVRVVVSCRVALSTLTCSLWCPLDCTHGEFVASHFAVANLSCQVYFCPIP